ncbi:hypothetical protein NVP1225O_54 [Vibrio phage 1.225.O._10N.261.48.B7]|nr:hypothetical protein NVP1225O_54 [Vibrio phage 1.225.O._10N.261.48.B7]
MTEQEYEYEVGKAGLSFYEKHGCCTSCLYGVDEPCECESLKKKHEDFQAKVRGEA